MGFTSGSFSPGRLGTSSTASSEMAVASKAGGWSGTSFSRSSSSSISSSFGASRNVTWSSHQPFGAENMKSFSHLSSTFCSFLAFQPLK